MRPRAKLMQTCVDHENTAAMATEILQPLDLVCETLYRSDCAIQTSPRDSFEDS